MADGNRMITGRNIGRKPPSMSIEQPERGSAAVLDRVPAQRPARSGGRVRQIDALRVLGCLSVVLIHAIGGPYPPDSIGLGQASFLLHFSREAFFFVSALVLVRTYHPRLGEDGRLPNAGGFRKRRLRLIGIPYLWWTTLYLLLGDFHTRSMHSTAWAVKQLVPTWFTMVFTGSAFYHMYFLLVTLQFGLLFPGVLWLLGRTRGYHGRILAGSLLLQVAILSVYQWVLLPDGWWTGLVGDAGLPAYQFWLIAGAIAGLHLERWHDWAMAHRGWILGSLPVSVGLLLWAYWAQVPTRGGLGASNPLQPIMIPYSISMIGVLYLSAVWMMSRRAGVQRAFGYVAQLSFGIYLVHPMVLDMVLALFRRTGLMRPSAWVAAIAVVATVTISIAVCAGLHRTALSQQLMGRARLLQPDSGRPGRARRGLVPALLLAVLMLGVLLIGGDATPLVGTGSAAPPPTVQASVTVPAPVQCIGVTDCPLDSSAQASSAASASGG
jgi:peptidoglycan/LPS O-acetylase OafA/YrhL